MASFKQEVLGMYLDQCVQRGRLSPLGSEIGRSSSRPPPAARTPTRKSSPRGERHQEKYKTSTSRRSEENYSSAQLDNLIAKKNKELAAAKEAFRRAVREHKKNGMATSKSRIESIESYLDDLRTIRSERGSDS
jgi:hypothetical protein